MFKFSNTHLSHFNWLHCSKNTLFRQIGYQLVKKVNEQWPGLIPTTVDVNSSAKSWLSPQNLWDFVSPHLHKEQDVEKSSLIASHVIRQLTTILSFLCDSEKLSEKENC